MKFKQAIQIGNNVTSIMELPCVFSCHKDMKDKLTYLLRAWDANGQYIEAHKGDWLCEDYDGKWCKLSDKEYGRL